MKKFSLKIRIFMASFCSLFISCSMFGNAFARDDAPYLIKAEMTVDSENGEFEAGGLDFKFVNKTSKIVNGFTLVFFLFDEDGEPLSTGQSNIVISVKKTVNPGESAEGILSLDRYLYVIPEEPYTVDYLYVSKIQYSNGGVWEDPLGSYCQ